jgi:hypothetical protein
MPDIFEQPGNNNDQAGHTYSMIIGAFLPKCLVRQDFRAVDEG